ncbi:hypothetical protein HDU99_009441, partial [Rhizoclosmatium hyalinum]
ILKIVVEAVEFDSGAVVADAVDQVAVVFDSKAFVGGLIQAVVGLLKIVEKVEETGHQVSRIPHAADHVRTVAKVKWTA